MVSCSHSHTPPHPANSPGRRKGLHLRSSPSRLGTVGCPPARLASMSAAMRCRSAVGRRTTATQRNLTCWCTLHWPVAAAGCVVPPQASATVAATSSCHCYTHWCTGTPVQHRATSTCTSGGPSLPPPRLTHPRCRRPRALQSGRCFACTRGRRTRACPRAEPQTAQRSEEKCCR